MLSFPLVDTHLHFIDTGRHRYPEIAASPQIHKTLLPADFDRLRGGVAVDKLVFVEVAVAEEDQLKEAEFASELAAADARIEAIVAAAPVEMGAKVVENHLERLSHLG